MKEQFSFGADDDLGALRFIPDNQASLEAALCAALGATVVKEQILVWAKRVDLASPFGAFPLFHDEDGSSVIELGSLPPSRRSAMVAALEGQGFRQDRTRSGGQAAPTG